MLDNVQVVLLIVIVILTILLVVLGIQVFFILRDLRRTIEKANKVLDNATSIAESIANPLTSLSSLTAGIQTGSLLTVVKLLKSVFFKEKHHHHDRKHEEE